jgi:hypothetical protein
MNQPEHELAKKVVRHLDYGLDRLKSSTREQLAAARRLALTRYRAAPEPVLGLAWAGQAMTRITEHRISGTGLMVAVAALVVATATVIYWQNLGPANDLAEIEISLLTDELPINAYLDKGFDSWLKRSSR